MFYLLEDNRIIDMNNICSQKEFIEENGKLKELTGFNLSSIGLQKFYNDVYVKKQSNNVLDLIEKGDLIKCCKYDFDGKTNEYDIHNVDAIDEEGVIIMSYTVAVRFKDIYAIYKPDDKGNYIKVWEREEENE